MCYEIYSNLNDDLSHLKTNRQLATNADNNGVLNHIIKILNHNNYYQYKNPELTNKRIKHIIDKAMLERDEIDLIRGILKNIEQHQK